MDILSLPSPIPDDPVPGMQEPSSSGDLDPQTHCNIDTFKRSNRAKRYVFKVKPGEIGFRLICYTSIVGGLIGNSGFIVSKLRRETSCKIHCEDAVPCTDDRVILVIGPVSPLKSITLTGVVGEDDGIETEVEISSAQEAVLRVFVRVWELEAEKGDSKATNGEVWCKLLAHTSQIGAVVGKGGKHIVTMRNNSGAKIRILPAPHCAAKDEELILITGGVLAVKKALIAVSRCLQDYPPLDKVSVTLSTLTVSSPPNRASTDLHAELFPHPTPSHPVQGRSLFDDGSKRTTYNNGASGHNTNGTEHEVVFRLLCSNSVAGSVIGKRGAIVRALESKTGASIIFAAPLSKFAERIVTISALENPESSHSPAQDAVILVFTRIIEDQIEKGYLSVSSMESIVTVRLLVASNTVSCLSGDEDLAISEMIKVTGADIQILQGEQIPCGASDDDVVVQITGEYRCVQNALCKVTCIIRDSLFALGKPTFPSWRLRPQNAGVQAGATSDNGKPHIGLSENSELGRANKLATVTSTTVEIVISEHVFGYVYGEDGGNLDQIRQISGADVKVYDPCLGETEGKVVISGTPDQTFAAQSLLQAFIQSGQRAP